MSVQFEEILKDTVFALSEGSVYERLRRDPSIEFDPFLAHATLIYEPHSASVLERVHREYLDVGQRYGLPMFALTDTWRANQERINKSKFKGHMVNQDNARFLTKLRDSYSKAVQPILIGGQISPRGDAYLPEHAPPENEAAEFHTPQIEALAQTEVDFLFASTLPALSEARGIARAMAGTGLPYILSFVIRADGTLLDGNSMEYAIEMIDSTAPTPPTGYAINCVHPNVLQDALLILENRNPSLINRLLSYQANTSPKRPEELDSLSELESEDPEFLAELMINVHNRFHIKVMGGCCGTSTSHIECLAKGYYAKEG